MTQKCRCCCEVWFDGFDRDDGTDIGGVLTESAGDWSISSGTLQVASANARALLTRQLASGGLHLEVDIKSSSTSGRARVIWDYIDANNFRYVEVRFGTGGSLRVGRVLSGSDSSSGTGVNTAADTWYALTVCVDEPTGRVATDLRTMADALLVTMHANAAITMLNPAVFGLGTGTGAGITYSFDNAYALKKNQKCAYCPKPLCQTTGYPCTDCTDCTACDNVLYSDDFTTLDADWLQTGPFLNCSYSGNPPLAWSIVSGRVRLASPAPGDGGGGALLRRITLPPKQGLCLSVSVKPWGTSAHTKGIIIGGIGAFTVNSSNDYDYDFLRGFDGCSEGGTRCDTGTTTAYSAGQTMEVVVRDAGDNSGTYDICFKYNGVVQAEEHAVPFRLPDEIWVGIFAQAISPLDTVEFDDFEIRTS